MFLVNSAVILSPKKKLQNYLYSTPVAPKLHLSVDWRFSFLENVNLVPNIEPWHDQEDEKCSKTRRT